ncbi:pilus assembly protein PilY [Acinetobacter sp. 2JN-4]|uniref:pilus assembly protein n=1 Tax=Acinetobacter sp. 2JN-4 TaxID=2479844 RepID=UPI000EF9D351|nr:PilC/PilY family type IV pilus protein [Acinetobacter sp. 2JN-4]RLZ10402.1 pilus assembly protein PilY [Acinetobacter sp. 2JN-4]
MKRQKNRLDFQHYARHFSYGASFVWAFTGTMLVAASVAQASDMQIYAVPTAGKKTIVMMLDTSGSMGPSSQNTYSFNDYGINSNYDSDCNQTPANGNSLSSFVNKKNYYVGSDPTVSSPYDYKRNFCYFSTSGATATIKKTPENGGCEAQKNSSGTITGYRCYDRLTRLKDGMFAFLDSNSNDKLPTARVGLGHYSINSGKAGKILVAAEALGAVGSSQRNLLKAKVAGLSASSSTPTANAFAEAAAYLMGTSTVAPVEIQVDVYKKETVTYECTNRSYPYLDVSRGRCWDDRRMRSWDEYISATYYNPPRITYYRCDSLSSTNFTTSTQPCSTGGWASLGPTPPSDLGDYTNNGADVFYKTEPQVGTNDYSGFSAADDALKNATKTAYKSPLPAAADRVSCDGQGIYILSDGIPTNNAQSNILATALQESSFSASGGLSGGTNWDYMSNFAKALFNGGNIKADPSNATNPVNVPIQTAFVGFGAVLNSLGSDDAKNACKMTSRTQADRDGDDACSPNQATNAVASPGYGNGGFFPVQTAEGVTKSVITFLANLGKAPLEPLTTGAISVPADALSPSGLQPYGYLRALEPNPQSNNMVWAGNLKRYKVVLTGANAGAFAGENGTSLVYNSSGAFNTGTKDLWNSSAVYDGRSYTDGGIISLGGASSRVPMPILGQAEDLTKVPKQYAFKANENALRRLFTNVTMNSSDELISKDNKGDLLSIPIGDAENEIPTTGIAAYVLEKFNEQEVLKAFSILEKQKLLNYLGFSVALNESDTALPETLNTPAVPHLAMGGSVHSFPVQLTYSGTLDASGQLTSTRQQSILYGTMDGGLHLVDHETGVEQMVFVPSEFIRNPVSSKALVKGASDDIAPIHGVDGAWVADALYKSQKATNATDAHKVQARQMNVYGGLRMGGESYYGLDVLNPKKPKLLFRIGRDQSDFSRMGQSWSKPVIANIRYDDEIRRVMIVGGGYDMRYESPTFALTGEDTAQGNAIYIVDAKTGERLWWASSTGANTNNSDMKHSIVSRVSAIDRNADGLIDHLYFGDLGGQVFRADLNNAVGTTTANFGKRVARLANLATTTTGTALTGGKNPRFYQAPTVTIHDQGAETFMLIGLASGNRSTPLDVYPLRGRDGMSPASALNDRLVNNVYGVIDRDFIKTNLISGTPTLDTEDLNLSNLEENPQLLTTNIIGTFVGTSATRDGWYRSLSSNSKGEERADNSFRIAGGMKSFEEPIALTGNLIVPVYDPQGTGIAQQDPCKPRVIGETDSQRFCLPYGVCLKSDGTVNLAREGGTGFQTTTEDCPPNVTECNKNVIGGGIVGLAPVPIKEPTSTNPCPDFSIAGNEKGNGIWNCIPTINPTRWYERWKK